MTPDDIIAVIERGMCHSADKAAECDVCATKRRAIAEVRTGREQLLAALAGIAERDAEIERLREEIAALRAEVERHERTGAYALGFTDGEGRTRALVAELKATVSAQDREREECRAELSRLRARDERTARVIEAARYAAALPDVDAVLALREALDALGDATDATDAAEIEAAHDLGAACGASVEERAAHRWSGWPGAWCLDCGIQDPREACLASGDCPCSDQVAAPCKVQVPPCTEPGSRRHDPYAERSVEERAAESAEPVTQRDVACVCGANDWIELAGVDGRGGWLCKACERWGGDEVRGQADLWTGPDFRRGDRVRFDDGPWRGQTAIITLAQIDASGHGHYDVTLDDGSQGSFPHSGPYRPTARRLSDPEERHRARAQQRIGACLSMPPELAAAELRAISEAERADEEGER